MGNKCIPKRKTKSTPKIKKGANGTSLFMPYFFEKIIKTSPTMAPDQKAITTPESAP